MLISSVLSKEMGLVELVVEEMVDNSSAKALEYLRSSMSVPG